MTKRDKAVEKALDPANLPLKQVRMIDKAILQNFFMGMTVHDIAVKVDKTESAVRTALNRPEVQRELKRLDTRIENELVRQKVGAARTLQEAAVLAAKQLVDTMKTAESPKDKNWAALKLIEYTLGKPKVSLVVSPGKSELSDEDWDEMEAGLDEVEKGKGTGLDEMIDEAEKEVKDGG